MINTDKYENHDMIRIAKHMLLEDAPLILQALVDERAGVERLREALVGDSKDWTTDELVEKALTLYDKALAFDTIYGWYERMQLQSESYENELDRMGWLLKNPTKEYEDFDCCNGECCGCGSHECCPQQRLRGGD